jgi:hypothetical protein
MYVMQKLSQTALVALLGLPVCQGAAAATCTFVTNASYYYDVARRPAKLEIQWDKSTGVMTSFFWGGDLPAETWIPFAADPGSVKPSATIYYYAVNIGVTAQSTASHEIIFPTSRVAITGYISHDAARGRNRATQLFGREQRPTGSSEKGH